MEETGILENPTSLRYVLPEFEPGPMTYIRGGVGGGTESSVDKDKA